MLIVKKSENSLFMIKSYSVASSLCVYLDILWTLVPIVCSMYGSRLNVQEPLRKYAA